MSLDLLRQLCTLYWNSIGILMALSEEAKRQRSPPLPADKHDTNLRHVEMLVREGASMAEVTAYLSVVEADYMGITTPAGSKDRFVEEAFRALRHPG